MCSCVMNRHTNKQTEITTLYIYRLYFKKYIQREAGCVYVAEFLYCIIRNLVFFIKVVQHSFFISWYIGWTLHFMHSYQVPYSLN